MAEQEPSTPKKRPGPAPTGKGTPILVRFQPELLGCVEEWGAEQADMPSRPEAIRRLVERGLKSEQ